MPMNITDPAAFIAECRARSGLNQRDLAAKSKVSEVTISRIINGHSEGSGRTLKKLRTFLLSLPPTDEQNQPPEAA